MSESRSRQLFYLGGLIGYLFLVFLLSHLPGRTLGVISGLLWDKGVHFFEYIPVGYLLYGALLYSKAMRTELMRGLIPVFALIAVAAFGALDELHQHFVPGRVMSFGDLIADTLGGAMGVLLSAVILRKRAVRTRQGSAIE